jgi:hypothetical protein
MIHLFSSFFIWSILATDTGKHFDVVGVSVELIVYFEEFSSSAFDPLIIEEKSFVDRPPVSL